VRSRDKSGTRSQHFGRAVPVAALVSAVVVAIGLGLHRLGFGSSPISSISVALAACLLAYLSYGILFKRIKGLVSKGQR
jgi:hypothetical protein